MMKIKLVLVLICFALAAPTPDQIAEFKALYKSRLENYLAPMQNDTQQCVKDLIVQIDNCRNGTEMRRMEYSFHGINDLGSYNQCNTLENSDYVVMNLNASTTPAVLRQGLCMPDSCSQGMYIKWAEGASQAVTNFVRKIIVKFNVDVYIAPPDLALELFFTKINV